MRNFIYRVPSSVKADLPYSDNFARTLRNWQNKSHPKINLKCKNLVELDDLLNKDPTLLNFFFEEEVSDNEGDKIRQENADNSGPENANSRQENATEKNHTLHHKLFDVGGRHHMLFCDEKFVREVRDTRLFFIDGTFSVVPRLYGTKQLLTIMVEKFKKVRYYLILCR